MNKILSKRAIISYVLAIIMIMQGIFLPQNVYADDVQIEINGFQISTRLEAFRTLYSISDTENKTEEIGLVYGLTDRVSEDEMVVNSKNEVVHSEPATPLGESGVKYSNLKNAKSYCMTMELIKNKEFYTSGISVRAYAKLKDGTYVYSKISNMTVFKIADVLYKNRYMSNISGHDYLYNDILSVVNPSYAKIDFALIDTIVTVEAPETTTPEPTTPEPTTPEPTTPEPTTPEPTTPEPTTPEPTTPEPTTPEPTTPEPTTQPPVEYGKPDLVVSEIYCEPDDITAGTGVIFKAKVTNIGTASTQEGIVVGVRFSIDSLNAGVYTWSDTHTSSIKPNESVILTANAGTYGSTWSAIYGTHTVYAWVDDVDRIEENNDDNNTNTKTINVKNASSGGAGGGSDTGSTEKGTVVGYPVPAGKTTSSSVTMTANGVKVGVFDTAVNNTHQWVDSYYPQLSTAEVGIFDFSGAAEVTMTVNYRVNSATIRPVGDGIRPNITYNGNTSYVTFTINKPGQYSVELNNNLTDSTMIFASAIEPEPTGNVIKIASGEVRYGDIRVGGGQTLYIEGGAAVYGRVFCESNSTVCGRGIIDQSNMDTWHGNNGQYPMSIEFANNVHVSGVAVLNSSCWNYQIYNSSDVHLDNIKIMSARPNGDGVSIQSSSYVYINDSFIRTWDDGIVLKNYSSANTHDVYVENTRLWTDLAQSMEIGFETNAGYGGYNGNPSIYNVKFNNVNVFHALHKAPISIHNGDNAEIRDITWSNITIEDCNVGQGDGWHLWLDITNVPAGIIPGAYGGWTHQNARGTVHDITLKNINVLSSSTTEYREWANGNGDIYNIHADNAFTYGR